MRIFYKVVTCRAGREVSLRRKFASLSVLMLMLTLGLGAFSNATVNGQVATSASGNANTNWPASSFNFQNTNYDLQNVINVNNVGNLRLRWFYQIPVNPFNIPGAPPALGIETQPIISQGIVYVATPYNTIIALSTTTGAVVW